MVLGYHFILTERSHRSSTSSIYIADLTVFVLQEEKRKTKQQLIFKRLRNALLRIFIRGLRMKWFLVTKLIGRDYLCFKELHHWSRWTQDAVNGHGINLHRLTEHINFVLNLHHNPGLCVKEGSCSRDSACPWLGDTRCLTFVLELCLFLPKLSKSPMPTARSRLSKIVLVSLFVFIVSVLVEESDQQILRSRHVESLCLRRCLLRAVKRSKTKVGLKFWSLV